MTPAPPPAENSAASGRRTIVDIFVNRPVLATVLSLFILLLGLRAAFELPVQQYPRIDASSLIITTVYVGAPADTVRGFITEPVERAVAAIPNIDYIDSTTNVGVSTVTVWLKFDADSSAALAQVSAQLDSISSDLPAEAEPPTIEVRRVDRPQALFYIAVTSDTRSLTQISEYLSREVQPAFSSLPGVQRIGLEGARTTAMRVWLTPTLGIVGRPLMQLGLHLQYPKPGNITVWPRLADIHQRTPGITVPLLRACCLPSPCTRLSRARTTTKTPSHPQAVNRRWVCPPPPWLGGGKG